MTRSIEQVLADWRERASHARMLRHEHDAQMIEDITRDVAEAAEPFMTWIGEADAALYTGHATSWLRGRFAQWERDGLARWSVRGKRERQYLQVVLPRRVDLEAVRADAMRAARGVANG